MSMMTMTTLLDIYSHLRLVNKRDSCVITLKIGEQGEFLYLILIDLEVIFD